MTLLEFVADQVSSEQAPALSDPGFAVRDAVGGPAAGGGGGVRTGSGGGGGVGFAGHRPAILDIAWFARPFASSLLQLWQSSSARRTIASASWNSAGHSLSFPAARACSRASEAVFTSRVMQPTRTPRTPTRTSSIAVRHGRARIRISFLTT